MISNLDLGVILDPMPYQLGQGALHGKVVQSSPKYLMYTQFWAATHSGN